MPPPDTARDAEAPFADRRVLVCICGGIAVYKTCCVVSTLVQRGAQVTCAMTRSATKFVRPLTFEALSGRAVLTSLWRGRDVHDPQHIHLARDADAVVVAPATANMIAKLANGLADDLISTVMLAVRCPVIVAPAMNDRMWDHPSVQRNISMLRDYGYRVVGPAEGWMACRSVGIGRMEEPDAILTELQTVLSR